MRALRSTTAAVATALVVSMCEWQPPIPAAQTPPPAAPAAASSRARQPRIGTGRIRGRVLSRDSGAPIRGAEVMLVSEEVGIVSTLTDRAGRYELKGLPPGEFAMIAAKIGYLSAEYGAVEPARSAKLLELADKAIIDAPDILMSRGRAVVGRIVDEAGEPLEGVAVRAVRQEWMNGRRYPMPAGRQGETNDLGEYRVYGLAPGQYHLVATLRPGGGPTPGMRGARGQQPDITPTPGYAVSYYPGTAAADEAQRVTVSASQDSSGVDFPLVPVRLTRIAGLVIGSDGRPVSGAAVMLVSRAAGALGAPLPSAETTRDGSFALEAVSPGDYTIAASKRGPVGFQRGGPPGTVTTSDAEFGTVSLKVESENASAVVIPLTRAATLRGRVVFDGQRPDTADRLRIVLLEANADATAPFLGATGPIGVRPDGTFELKGVSGTCVVRPGGVPSGWTVRSIQLGGVDVTDTGIDFKPGETVSGLEVHLSPRVTEVSGVVVGASGKPALDYTVVVFAEDSNKWRFASGRWISGTGPMQDGRFRIKGMPAGAYLAVAVDHIPDGDWLDPEVLERLRPQAQRFSLDEGQRKTLDLKLRDGGF